MKRWFVYIVLNRRGTAYTGVTYDENPDRRIAEHNGSPGSGARFTRGRGPWRLIYAETGFSNRAHAQIREHELRKNRHFKSQLKENLG